MKIKSFYLRFLILRTISYCIFLLLVPLKILYLEKAWGLSVVSYWWIIICFSIELVIWAFYNKTMREAEKSMNTYYYDHVEQAAENEEFLEIIAEKVKDKIQKSGV